MLLSMLPMTGVPVEPTPPAIEARDLSFDAWQAETQADTWVVGGMFDQNQGGSPQLEGRYASAHSIAKTGLFLYIGGTVVAVIGTFIVAGAIVSGDSNAATTGVLVLLGGDLVGLVGFGLMLGGSFGAQSALSEMGSPMTKTLGIASIVLYGAGLILGNYGSFSGNSGLSTVGTLCGLGGLSPDSCSTPS